VLTRNYLWSRANRPGVSIRAEQEDGNLDSIVVTADDKTPSRDFASLPPEIGKIAAMLTLGYQPYEIATHLHMSRTRLDRIIRDYISTRKAA
jgi:hypothetical protein